MEKELSSPLRLGQIALEKVPYQIPTRKLKSTFYKKITLIVTLFHKQQSTDVNCKLYTSSTKTYLKSTFVSLFTSPTVINHRTVFLFCRGKTYRLQYPATRNHSYSTQKGLSLMLPEQSVWNGRASVCWSVSLSRQSTTAVAYGGFAAKRAASRRYRSIVGVGASSNDAAARRSAANFGQCHSDRRRRLNTDLLLQKFHYKTTLHDVFWYCYHYYITNHLEGKHIWGVKVSWSRADVDTACSLGPTTAQNSAETRLARSNAAPSSPIKLTSTSAST